MEGGTRDCGEGWRVMSTPLECSHAATAVDFAPTTSPDKRCIQEHIVSPKESNRQNTRKSTQLPSLVPRSEGLGTRLTVAYLYVEQKGLLQRGFSKFESAHEN